MRRLPELNPRLSFEWLTDRHNPLLNALWAFFNLGLPSALVVEFLNMSHSKPQALQIQWLLEIWMARKKTMADAFIPGSNYELRLRKAGFHMASLMVGAQGIEQLIKLILYGYAKKGELLKILNAVDPLEKMKLSSIENETLGALIEILRQIIGKSKVIDDLWILNNYRIQVVHHIFLTGNLDKIKKYEEKIREYLNDPEINTLLESLMKELHKIDEQIETLSKE